MIATLLGELTENSFFLNYFFLADLLDNCFWILGLLSDAFFLSFFHDLCLLIILLMVELVLDQIIVVRFFLDQIIMSSLLDQSALAQNNNVVCLLDCRKTVGYDQRCLALSQFMKGFLNFNLVFSVKGRRRLIENKHGRILQNGSSNGKSLLLASRNLGTARTNKSVKAIFHLFDKLPSVG